MVFFTLTLILAAVPAFADSDLTIFGAHNIQGQLTLRMHRARLLPRATSIQNLWCVRNSIQPWKGDRRRTHVWVRPEFLRSEYQSIIYNSDLMVQAPLPKIRPYGVLGWRDFYVLKKTRSPTGRPSVISEINSPSIMVAA